MKPLKCLMAAMGLAVGLMAAAPSAHAQVRLWGTYYGGSNNEVGEKVATDAAGNVYIVGNTTSPDGIVTPNSFDSMLDLFTEPTKGYLAKFNSSGMLVWATYYGDAPGFISVGNEGTEISDLGLDASGNVYIIGTVACPSQGPELATPDAHDTSCTGSSDTFIAKFDPNGKRLWGTYLGGESHDIAQALSVMLTGEIYVVGYTHSTQGLVVGLSQDASLGGNYDGFVAKFNSQGQMAWSRYFGGPDYDFVNDIVCKRLSPLAPDRCFIAGMTESTSAIATAGAFDTVKSGGNDAFVARIDGANGARLWGTYYGGTDADNALSIAIDSQFNIFVGGDTKSTRMATLNTHDSGYNGDWDMYMAKFNAQGLLLAATYYGNSDSDQLKDITVDGIGNVYLVGNVKAHGGLVTLNAFDTTFSGNQDGVIAKFNPNLLRMWATYYGGNGIDSASGIKVDKNNHVYVTGTTDSTDAFSTPGSHQTTRKAVDSFLAEFIQ